MCIKENEAISSSKQPNNQMINVTPQEQLYSILETSEENCSDKYEDVALIRLRINVTVLMNFKKNYYLKKKKKKIVCFRNII